MTGFTTLHINGEPIVVDAASARWTYLTGAYVDYLGLQPIPINQGRQTGVGFLQSAMPFPKEGVGIYREAVLLDDGLYYEDGDGWTLRGAPIGSTKVSDHYILKSVFRDELEGALRDQASAINRLVFGRNTYPISTAMRYPPRHARLYLWLRRKSQPLRRRVAKKIYDFEGHEDWDY